MDTRWWVYGCGNWDGFWWGLLHLLLRFSKYRTAANSSMFPPTMQTSNPNNSYNSELSSPEFQNSRLRNRIPMDEFFQAEFLMVRTPKPSLNVNAKTSRPKLRLTRRLKGRKSKAETYSKVEPSTFRLRRSNRMDGS